MMFIICKLIFNHNCTSSTLQLKDRQKLCCQVTEHQFHLSKCIPYISLTVEY